MTKLKSFKMPFETNHFNKNQRVWIVILTGSLAAYCCGKFRGKNRYVRAWVKWEAGDRNPPAFQDIMVRDAFAKRVLQ